MKQFKVLVALVLVAMMSLALVGAALADTTITISPQTPSTAGTGTTLPDYTYWVFMKASVGSGDAISYYVEDETKANALDALKVDNDDLFTVVKAAGADQWFVTINKKSDNSAFSGIEVAAALATNKANALNGVDGTSATKGTDNSTITLNYDGYVLIESSLGTKLIVDTYTTKTVNEKNEYPGNTKTEDKSTAEIGEVVTYTVTVSIPANVANKPIVVVDTITNGLTLNTAITVSGDENPTVAERITSLTFTLDSTIAAVAADPNANPPVVASKGAKVYKATIPAATVLANAGKTLTLQYTATVNEDAIVDDPEINKAHIEYDNFKTIDVQVQVKTFGFELEKVDKTNHNLKLEGVTFTLKNSDNEYYTIPSNASSADEDRFVALASGATAPTVATDSDGKVTFAGLHAGTYTLTEISNPNAGYNMLASAITVTVANDGTITADDGTVQSKVLTVENAKGAILPSTGGIGTTIFYIAGAVLVLGAAAVILARRKAEQE